MKKLLLLITALFTVTLVACSNGDNTLSTDNIIQAFKDDGLEVGDVSDLDNQEFGDTRTEGKRIIIPSLGDDAGGRLFVFKDKKGLEAAKNYYDELGESSPLFFSHTHQNGLVLLQMNGDMSDEDFTKYKTSIDNAMK